MACCGKKIKIPKDQKNVIKAVRNSNSTKSNRSPAGTIATTCSNCFTKTVTAVCPICGLKIR